MESTRAVTRAQSKLMKAVITQERDQTSVRVPSIASQRSHRSQRTELPLENCPDRTAVRNIVESNKSAIKSTVSSQTAAKSVESCTNSQGKSHSRHSKSSSTMRRMRLEAQIRADRELDKLLEAEEQLELQKLQMEQKIAKRKIEYQRKMIEKKLALEDALCDEKRSEENCDIFEDKPRSDIDVPEIPESEKVCDWLDQISITEPHHTERNENAEGNENDIIKMILARQTIDKDLPIFTGDTKEWPNFWNQYISTTKLLNLSDEENICRLRKSLKGEARRATEGLLIASISSSKIIDILKNRFGRPDLIVNSLINEAKNMHYIKSNDLSTLTHFSDVMRTLVATLESLNMEDHLRSPQLLSELVQKLPFSMQISWGKKLASRQGKASLRNFQEWIANEAEGVSYVQVLTNNKRNKYSSTLTINRESSYPKRKEINEEFKRRRTECVFCEKEHKIEKCDNFKKLTPEEKWKFVKNKNVCFSCMRSNHRINSCQKKKQCGINNCKKYHHSLLHDDKFSEKQKQEQQQQTQQAPDSIQEEVIAHTTKFTANRIFLKVAPVVIKNGEKEIKTFALFDEASTITLLDEDVAHKLGLRGTKTILGLKWTDKKSRIEVNSTKVSFKVSGYDKKEYQLENVHTMKDMDLPIQSVNAKKFKEKWRHLQDIDFDSYVNASPKLLIGQDNWNLITTREIVEGPKNTPALSRTLLGWVLHGNVQQFRRRIDDTILFIKRNDTEQLDELHNMVKHFFSTEEVTRRVGDRWETGLLWKEDNVKFPQTFPTALQRLRYIEKKIDQNQEFSEAYSMKINDYLQKGYARKLSNEEIQKNEERTWYLPHFAVTNENKPGKIRFVLDAAAKVENKSLNNHLLKGPDLFNSLLGIIMKFRQFKIAFSADIKEMFHQVRIRQEDQAAQRFLWRENKDDKEPSVYTMTVMIFGAISSPYSAQYVKNRNAMEFIKEYPQAVDAILHKHYMDDYLDSVNSEEEAIRLVKEVIMIHQKGGFELRGWTSNSKNLLNEIPLELKNQKDDLSKEHIMPCERILGLKWDPNEDTIYFPLNFHKVDDKIIKGEKIPTKRELLKVVMSIYDPLGLLGKYVVKGKILLQETWRSGIHWDHTIPEKLTTTWFKWLKQLQLLGNLKIPRCYNLCNYNHLQLHIFCDASEEAFGSVGYFRFSGTNEIKICLIMSKTQVAPLRPISIPRLELQAAIIGVRIAKIIKQEHTLNIQEMYFWVDSKTVLCWIRSEARNFKTFVAHRVGEIQEKSDVKDWHWVPTKDNVADELTRQKENSHLNVNNRWFRGPEFLYQHQEEWPKEEDKDFEENTRKHLELKSETVLTITQPAIEFLPNMHKFSCWMSLIRSTAKVFKFIHLCRKHTAMKEITTEDVKIAEHHWFKRIQKDSFNTELRVLKEGKTVEKNSKLYQLTPILINDLICINGRTNNATELTEETKNPIILDAKHFAVKLLILYYHKRTNHSGVEMVFNEIRQKFWIIQARKAIKTIPKYCTICSIRRANPQVPQMGQLPYFRLSKPSPLRPFIYVGMDYFGGYQVTIGRRKEIRYGVIFTCLSVRAIHIETAESLNTDSTLLAIRRFISRRGQPKMIISDNGTNLHGADKELRNYIKELDQEKIRQNMCAQEITWKFIPPASPHMGGSWERMVRSVKTALKLTLKERCPRPEVLETLLIEAEHIVNSRPLTYVSTSAEDPESLTPNHFLMGTSSIVKPPGLFDQKIWDIKKQWRISQTLTELFWNRWLKEYIPTLTKRTKWFKENRNLSENDCVVVMDNKLPRNNWPFGRIVKTYPGADGKVRVADVKLKDGIYQRPVSKLCRIECLEMGEEHET